MRFNQRMLPSALLTGASGACLGLALLVTAPGAVQAQSPCGPSTTVEAGETMFSISERCDTSVEALQRANPDVDPHGMEVGITLQIEGEVGELGAADPPTTGTPGEYTVQPGDTTATIATALGVTMQSLLDANPELDSGNLPVGQPIILPPDAAPPEVPDDRRSVAGVMTDEGVECQAMRGQDGQLYTLIGELEGYGTGDLVEVRGSEPGVDICQQGVTIEVENIRGVG